MKPFTVFCACLIAELCSAQTIVYSTYANGSISAYIIVSNDTSSTSTSSGGSTISSTSSFVTSYPTSTTTSTEVELPTTPYTGQSLLTGTCSIPVYTAIRFEKGNVIQVPLIGCSDDRPECCPSLASLEVTATPTLQSSPDISATTASFTPTGVISMLSEAPLTICPSDMVDIDPVCCPSGFTVWDQKILGNQPCASLLSTSYPMPSSVFSSITSEAGASVTLSSGQATATASIEIIANIVFALGLPCAEEGEEGGEGKEGEEEHKGLSTGAKAGIGAGVGVGALLAIALVVWACLRIRRRKKEKAEPPRTQPDSVSQTTEYPKMPPSSGGWSPASTHDAGFAGYGQGFVDGVKAALTPPPVSPQSPPPFYVQPRMSIIQPPVEAPTESMPRDRGHRQDHAAELSGTTSSARSDVWA